MRDPGGQRIDRVRYREAVTTTSPKKAAQRRIDRIAEVKRGEHTPDSQRLTVGALLDLVVTDYTVNGYRSLTGTRSQLEAVRAALGTMRAQDVTTDYLFHGPRCAAGRKPSKRYGCIGDFKKAWATAMKAAGFPVGRKAGGYTFHHTRNTAATDMRAAGMSTDDIMDLAGWKTTEMVRRYQLKDVEALRARLKAARGMRRAPLRRLRG